MEHRNRLEEIKREYQEIRIPEQGTDGVKAAMERAMQRKRRKARMITYASMAASVAILLFAAPQVGLRLFAGGSAASESAGRVDMNKAGWSDMLKAEDAESVYENPANASYGTVGDLVTETAEDGQESLSVSLLADAAVVEKIRMEIADQINRRAQSGEEAFISMLASSQFQEYNPKEQEYFLNENDLLVIRYAPGTLAPERFGAIEFIIPNEVWR